MDYEKYDNYDAYNLDKAADLEEFIDSHVDYMMNGGLVGLPFTFLDKYVTGPDHMLEIIDSLRPWINGKEKYRRIIVKFSDRYINDLKAISEGEDMAMVITRTEENKRAAAAAAKRAARWNGTGEPAADFDAVEFWNEHMRISNAVAACIDAKHWVKAPWAETSADAAKDGTKYVFTGIDMQKVKAESGTGVWLWPDELTGAVMADLRAMTQGDIEADIEKNIAYGAVTNAGMLAQRIGMAACGMGSDVQEAIEAIGRRAWLLALKEAAQAA